MLGDEHVDRATAAAGLDADFQRWLTEAAWGGLWTRDAQLDRRARSCVTIAVLTALRAEHELAMHVRAGIGEIQMPNCASNSHTDAAVPLRSPEKA